MRVRYQRATRSYRCDKAHARFDVLVCGRDSAVRVDALVENLVLGVVDAGVVDLALAYDRSQREEEGRLERLWREKPQWLGYACELARRRYESIDHANWLVAQTLEKAWSERLVELEAARAEYARQPSAPPVSTPAETRAVLGRLREL